MDIRLSDAESSKSKLDKVIDAINQNISAQNDTMEECVSMLSQSFSSKNDVLLPEENHKDLKNLLEILCRLPSMCFQFTNNFNTLGSMDTAAIIQKYICKKAGF
ncbi:uncharacterized protein [Halyomorpha halys]|uniref:uncharacterized protein isoform X2 n=1 Tax=Halyomorpha halys TaxID=286706 RepID=UPI0034D3455E